MSSGEWRVESGELKVEWKVDSGEGTVETGPKKKLRDRNKSCRELDAV
jgi:hypothetical protein